MNEMSEIWLHRLIGQAVLFSAALLLLALLRPWLLRKLGATAVYGAWLLVPALLITSALPRPAQEPLQVVLQAASGSTATTLPALPAPAANHAALWLALWIAGAAMVAIAQARQQWQLARLGTALPAGSSPALVGLLRPRVVLPVDFELRFSPAQRELILAHEHVHLKRLDNLWNLLACALTALHWWNPLAWWSARRFQTDQELACDAAVLASRPSALADYTQALLAAHDLHHLGAPLASRWGTHHPLVERIAMLTTSRSPRRRHLLVLVTAMLGAVGASYAVQTSADAPPVIEGILQLRYDVRVSLDGKEITHPRLVSFPVSPTSIVFNEPDQPRLWKLEFSGRFADEKHLMVETALSLGEDEPAILAWQMARGKAPFPQLRQVAAPRLLIADGGAGRVETTTPDGKHRLTLDIQVSSFRNASPDYSAPKF